MKRAAEARKDREFDFSIYGDRLEYLLMSSGMTARKLSLGTGVSDSAISQLRDVAAKTSVGEASIKIADYFGVPVSWLTFGEGEVPEVGTKSPSAAPTANSRRRKNRTSGDDERAGSASGEPVLGLGGLTPLQVAALTTLRGMMGVGQFGDEACLDMLAELRAKMKAGALEG